MRVQEIANLVKGTVEGDKDLDIQSAASLENAGPADIAFVAKGKNGSGSRAGCLVVTADHSGGGQTLIRVKEPRAAFAQVVSKLHPPPPVEPGIHPSAVVAPDAKIGAGVFIGPHVSVGSGSRIGDGSRIGPGCAIGANVTIGAGATLHPRVVIYDGATIGDRAILHSGCVVGADGFGFVLNGDRYEKFPQIGRVVLGDDVELGANVCVDRAALGTTEIGDGSKLDNLVHVGHNCRIGRHVLIVAQTGLSGGVVIEDYAVIGGQVGIGDKARIESRAVVGSGAGILTSKIVRAGQVVWGTPARPLKEYLQQLAHLAQLPALKKRLIELERKVAAK
ncbi:MAG TPA: UDP-3-O-(3-hydroxymyristoyl)glucosamine N-acyltransferase [Bryobacteraceae bacterium]|nr:UDP-3-O-(3-hydroxymyristoyl)glucosamine N-acyltransferase [Bryobacteraceae bacterium]